MFEIGNSLKEARLRRSIEFGHAETATKIRAKYLRALEAEQFEQLPSETYTKGFLRAYAEYLGLDGQFYVDEFNSRFNAVEDAGGRPRRSTVRPERRNRRVETALALFAIALISILTVVLIGAWGSSSPHSTKTTPAAAHHKAGPVTHAPLEITALRSGSYVEVHRDGPRGALLFEGTMIGGKTEPFTGQSFWLSVSTPENIILRTGGNVVALSGHKPRTVRVGANGVRPG